MYTTEQQIYVYVFVQFQQGNDGEMAVDAVLVDDSPPVPDDVVLAGGLTQ